MNISQLIALSLTTCSLSATSLASAAVPRIFPTPQENGLTDSYTAIEQIRTYSKPSEGDAAIWAKLPDKQGAYALVVSPRTLTIYARHETGAFYARQTIIQLLSKDGGEKYLYAQKDPFVGQDLKTIIGQGKLPLGTLIDWPDMPYRGTVEGYYGAPWSHEARKSQFEFYGRNKLNTYIWAPKDDPYHHGAMSYEPYPEEIAKQIAELCQVAKANHVKFVWAVHPANTVNWSKDGGKYDLNRLVQKLEQMYKIGVRDFGVFIDDSNGEINKAERQVALCNYIQEHFIATKKDVGPIIMCPTGYNKAWSNKDYLGKLGSGLTKDQHVMWTGNSVCHDITLEGQQWVKETLGRPTFIWWNWPVHDYCTAHLPMGRTYGLAQDPQMLELMTGFVSNPMALPEASKTALFGVGDYSWNIMDFDSVVNWKDGMKRLYPTSHEAMQTFANHSSDLGNNFHGYRREESVDIQPTAKALEDSIAKGEIDTAALSTLEKEFSALKSAAQQLKNAPDTTLVSPEIMPWLDLAVQLGDMGVYASKALTAPTLQNFTPILNQWDKWTDGGATRTQHAPRVVGWTVLRPLVTKMVDDSQRKLYTSLSGIKLSKPTFTASNGNAPVNSEKIFDNNDSSFWDTGTTQRAGDWYALDLGAPTYIKNIKLHMGGPRSNDYIAEGQFEISQDNKQWQPVGKPQSGAKLHLDVTKNGAPIEARYVRYRALKDKSNWLAITTFGINSAAAPYAKSDVSGWENLNVARQEKKFFGISRNFEVKSMQPNQSVSMVLPTPVSATWMEVNFENPSIADWADITLTLEDGSTVKPSHNMQGSVLIAKQGQLPTKRITAMTLRNKSQQPQEVKMNMFKLDCPPLDPRDSAEAMSDRDLLSYYNASQGVNETLPVPANVTKATIIGKNLKLRDAKQISENEYVIRLGRQRALHLESAPAKDARVYEVIFGN